MLQADSSTTGGVSLAFVLPLEAIGRSVVSEAGSKAANLGEAMRAGFPVPPGEVVTTRAFERFLTANHLASDASQETVEAASVPDDVALLLRAIVASMGNVALAVRSSGIEEDLPGASFAGQYETVLNVRGADSLVEAVRRCWASAFSPRVLAYRRSHDLTGVPRMAVLVQRLVPADAAGVAFTANPVTGDRDEVVIEAVRGLGDRLVSGSVDADEWVVRDGRPDLRREAELVLRPGDAKAISELARRVEEHFGGPQDIEWAMHRGELFLLQARPITALPDALDWTPPAPGAWIRNLRLGEWLGEPLTPLFEAWLVERLDDVLWAHLHSVIHAPLAGPHHVVVNGYYYATANFLPENRARMVWFGVRYFLPGLILRPRRVAIIFPGKAYWGMQAYEREWRSSVLPRYRSAVAEATSRVETANRAELVALVDQVADAAGACFVHVTALAGSAWKPEYLLASFYRTHLLPRIGGNHVPLLQGLGAPAADAPSHASPSLDWFHPTLGERGARTHAAPSERRARVEEERRAAEEKARAALRNRPRLARRFDLLLERAQWAAVLREEVTLSLTLGWPVMRRALLRLGRLLRTQGLLSSDDDVFFLTRDELVRAVAGSADPGGYAARARERRGVWEHRRRLAPPRELGALSPLAQGMLGRFEATLGARSAEGGVGLRGLPASPGRATGPVRVVRSGEDFNRFQPGEVLVAPATNPAWTPLLARAAAVVTDTGSLMAHASLVAREYGIPAVVGAGDATSCLVDGQLVTVDGTEGTVQLVVREGASGQGSSSPKGVL